MSREIKFRAFPNNEGKKYYKPLMYEVYSTGSGISSEIVYENKVSDILNKYLNIMQFTGLKDKNGKEIYEEDIVDSKLYDGTRKNYIVRFKDGSFMVGLTELGKWVEDIIVIGNIYENPELLTKP